jgi:hypothetical protein
MMAEESVRPKSRKGRMEPRIGLDGNIDRFFVNNPVGVDPVECQQSAVAAGYIDSTVSVPEIQRLFTKKPHKYTKLPGTNKYILKRLLIAKGNGNHPEGHPDTI